MADLDAIFDEVVKGLVDNSRVNEVKYDEGWDAALALQIYFTDDEAVFGKYGPITDLQRDKLLARIGSWLEAHKGKSWHDEDERFG